MIRPTELIEKLKVSSKAADGGWHKGTFVDSVPTVSPENLQALLRWVEVLERALYLRTRATSDVYESTAQVLTWISEAARELEARDE